MKHIPFHNDTINLNDIWYQSHRNLIENIAIDLGHIDKIKYLTETYLNEPLKIKKLKDPSKPKRAKSSYLYFCAATRNEIKEHYPDLKMGGVMKELAKKWSVITVDQKKEFELLSGKDKERYLDEMETYTQNSN